jgi:Spy/CpxP family protein refolding chaperone
MRVLRVVLVLLVALVIASPVLAQEKKRGKKGERGGARGAFDPMARLLEGLDLTDEQKAKVAEVRKEFGPKLAEFQKKSDGILTDEQKKDRAEAMKEAKSAGKSPRESYQAVQEAMKLTDEQKSQMREIGKERGGVEKEMRSKIMEILTPEQREQVEKKIQELKKGGKKKQD